MIAPKRVCCAALVWASWFVAAPDVTAGPASAPAVAARIVLTEKHFWWKHYTFFPPRLSVAGAKAAAVELGDASRAKALEKHYHSGFQTPLPPEAWKAAEFEDAAWLLERGRQFLCGDSRAMSYARPDATSPYLRGTDPFVEEVGLVCQRGKFLVNDRSKVGKLLLSLTYRGGFVAYLNGREVARASLPAGRIAPHTPAKEYPLDAFFLKDGTDKRQPLHWYSHRQSPQWELRERQFGPVEVDRSALRNGVNVLAVEFHRTDYPAECRRKTDWRSRPSLFWATLGLSLLSLRADAAEGAVEPAGARRDGLQLWSVDVTTSVSDLACPNYDQTRREVRIVGARNGKFSGQVIVASPEALPQAIARATGLRHADGKASIPAGNIEIAYGAVNPTWGGGLNYLTTVLPDDMDVKTLGRRFDALLAAPPAGAGATPIWITVTVPADAPAGRYTGTLAVRVQGAEPTDVPIHLYVADWTLPDVKDYDSLIHLYQSPDTLARYYKLQPW